MAPLQLAEQALTATQQPAAQQIRQLLAEADPASGLPSDHRTRSRAQALQLADAHRLEITRTDTPPGAR